MSLFVLFFGLMSGCFLSVLVGIVGSKRRIGFGWAFLASLFLTPLVGLLLALISDPLPVGTDRGLGCIGTLFGVLGLLFLVAFLFLLLAGGMLEMIRYNGGIAYIIERLTRHVSSKRFAELSIAGLVCLANLCTANNTIAIITTGPIARNIAERFHIDRRKSASILDTFSCFIQGIIPYGAQMLIAAELADLSPLAIIRYLYYPVLIGIFGLLAIAFRYPRHYS